jgi:hypothetical protein
MRAHPRASAAPPIRRRSAALWLAILLTIPLLACSPYVYRHGIQWDSMEQVGLAQASQVQLRAAQSRVFEADRTKTLEAIVTTFQDMDFQVEVLDETLGIVAGKKFVTLHKPTIGFDPFYYLYDDQSLLVFSKSYRTWGPFQHRTDTLRLTVTLRNRNESQLIVRAAAQFFLQAVEAPEPYQQFFRSLEQALFIESQLLQ